MVNWNEIAKRVKNDATYINLFCSGHGSLETLPVSKPTIVNRSFDSVLDFGCGVGRNLPYFKSVAKKVRSIISTTDANGNTVLKPE